MTKRVKIILLWLLALAIPVQGFAAAVQMGCAPSHQNPIQAVYQVVPATSMAGHHAGHDMHMAAHDDAGAADHHPQPHQHQASSASCSSCSVCTIGAILPLALDKLINLPVTADIHVAMAQHGYVGYTPENPERPPSLPV